MQNGCHLLNILNENVKLIIKPNGGPLLNILNDNINYKTKWIPFVEYTQGKYKL